MSNDIQFAIVHRTDENPQGVRVLAWSDGSARVWPLRARSYAELEAVTIPGAEVWQPPRCSVWLVRLP